MNEYRTLTDSFEFETAENGGAAEHNTASEAAARPSRLRPKRSAFQERPSKFRRFVALVCVAFLVGLQCFVVMPMFNGQAHASEDLDISSEYDGGTTAHRQVSSSWIKKNVDSEELELSELDPEGNPVTVDGYNIRSILSNAGISDSTIESTNVDIDGYIVVRDNELFLYNNGELEDISDIDVTRTSGTLPVSFAKKPKSSKSKPTVGEIITISYKLKVDKFYKNSDSYSSSDLDLTWSSNNRASLSSDSSTGISGSIQATVKSKGKIVITPASEAFPEMTDGVTVSFVGKATTTTTKATTTTRYTYSPYRPTTRYTGGTISRPTGTTGPTEVTTATRPTETASTAEPSFQTITVKEVFLTPVQQEQSGYDDGSGTTDSSDDNTDDSNKDYDEDGVKFPAAAGSAAVAMAAGAAGAVGRIRRYRFDMSGAAAAAVQTAAGEGTDDGKGKPKFLRGRSTGAADQNAAKAQNAAGAPGQENSGKNEKSGKNPLNKFRRKS